MIRVLLVQQKKELQVPGPATVSKILDEIGVKKTTTVVVSEKRILTPDRTVEDGTVLEVISVVSGG
ncbi:MAG: thiamine biosynthesis protein ThiS [Deltaproteobacteria bacterium]|nr:thiamine biosynthesis protein ThiS [Deltaproteobacteria bacterium]NIS78236.1 thiamine biosynthesis protein ThiS [Deltaproteobacteria bacterium]